MDIIIQCVVFSNFLDVPKSLESLDVAYICCPIDGSSN